MKKPILVTALVLSTLSLGTAFATATAKPQKSEAATSAKLELQSSISTVEFLVTGDLGGISVPGRLSEDYKGTGPLTGELTLKNNVLSGTASYELNALTTGMNLRDKHMKEKYLEVAKHPMAKLKLHPTPLATVPTSGKAENIAFTADMEVKGIIKPVSGKLTVERNGDDYKLQFQWELKLTDYGVETPSFMDVTLTEQVNLQTSIKGKFKI